MPHSNNKQFPTITFYSSHLHHLTTTSHLGRWHDDEAVSKDGAPSAHSAPKSLFAGLEVHKIAHHGYDDPEQNISRLLKHQFSLALLSSVSHQELASSISTDLRVLSQQRSSKAPHPTNTLQQFAQWKATLLHKNLVAVRNAAVSFLLRRSAPTATRRRSSRFLANLAGQVHFLVYGLGSTNTRMSNTVHRFFSSASSILRSLTLLTLWPSCVNFFFTKHATYTLLSAATLLHCEVLDYPKVKFSDTLGIYISIVCLIAKSMDTHTSGIFKLNILLRYSTSSYFVARAQHHITTAQLGFQICLSYSSQHEHFASAYFMHLALRFAHRLYICTFSSTASC